MTIKYDQILILSIIITKNDQVLGRISLIVSSLTYC